MTQPQSLSITSIYAASNSAQPAIFIDLDDRAVVYPAGKGLTRITMIPESGGIAFDATYAFNDSKSAARLFWLSLADAREFGRCLVDSVYQAKPQNAITETMRIGITVHPNGFVMQIGDVSQPVELFIGLNSIWRFAVTVLRAVDRQLPISAN